MTEITNLVLCLFFCYNLKVTSNCYHTLDHNRKIGSLSGNVHEEIITVKLDLGKM